MTDEASKEYLNTRDGVSNSLETEGETTYHVLRQGDCST